MYARNVKGLSLQNVRFEYRNAEARPAIIFDNVQDAAISNLSVQGSLEAESTVRIVNSTDVLFGGTRLLSRAQAFMKLEGTNVGITVDGGDISKAARPVVHGAGVADRSVKLRV